MSRRPSPRRWNWTSPRSSPRWQVLADRRIAWRSRTCGTRSSTRSTGTSNPIPSRRRSVDSSTREGIPTRVSRSKEWTEDVTPNGRDVRHGSVVIAAITSCTNTSNPSVMVGAGLLAKRAVEAGLESKPWVKTSLAPGSQGRDRLPGPCGADAVPGEARVQPRGVRLHDVHRELRAAPRRRGEARSTTRS